MRELVVGSKAADRLIPTDAGWELRGDPAPSERLAQLRGERFKDLNAPSFEALAHIAIAGELPREAVDTSLRRTLARTGLLEISSRGWLRLADPLDREVIRAHCSEVLWNELTREVAEVLRASCS